MWVDLPQYGRRHHLLLKWSLLLLGSPPQWQHPTKTCTIVTNSPQTKLGSSKSQQNLLSSFWGFLWLKHASENFEGWATWSRGRLPNRNGSTPFQNSSSSTDRRAMSHSGPIAKTWGWKIWMQWDIAQKYPLLACQGIWCACIQTTNSLLISLFNSFEVDFFTQ